MPGPVGPMKCGWSVAGHNTVARCAEVTQNCSNKMWENTHCHELDPPAVHAWGQRCCVGGLEVTLNKDLVLPLACLLKVLHSEKVTGTWRQHVHMWVFVLSTNHRDIKAAHFPLAASISVKNGHELMEACPSSTLCLSQGITGAHGDSSIFKEDLERRGMVGSLLALNGPSCTLRHWPPDWPVFGHRINIPCIMFTALSLLPWNSSATPCVCELAK